MVFQAAEFRSCWLARDMIGQTGISELMEPSSKERKAANRIRFIDFEGLGPCCPDRRIRARLTFLLKRSAENAGSKAPRKLHVHYFRSMLSLVHQNTHEEPTAKLWQVFASSDDDPEPYNLQQAQSRYSYEVLCLAVLWFCAEATHDDCPLAHHQQQQLERQQQQQHQQLQQQHKHCHDCHGFLLCCVVLFSFFVFLWLLLAVSRRLGGS